MVYALMGGRVEKGRNYDRQRGDCEGLGLAIRGRKGEEGKG